GFALTLRHFPAVVTIETALGICVLVIVPFLAGSARAQAGDGVAPTVDGNILFLGLLLVACLGATLYTSHRVSLLLTHRAAASGYRQLNTRGTHDCDSPETSAVARAGHGDHTSYPVK